MGLDELNDQLQELVAGMKEYFGQLSDEERYGWIAEGLGMALVLAGAILFVV